LRSDTDQEQFWAGDFGRRLIDRTDIPIEIDDNLKFFQGIISWTGQIGSIIEFGPYIGLNLRALKSLIPEAQLSAVEINDTAIEYLKEWGRAKIYQQSIFDFSSDETFDLVLTKKFLIHIHPKQIEEAYRTIYRYSRQYICICEYFSPDLLEVNYRSHKNQLFKRDFASDMLNLFSDIRLVDYGFIYGRDRAYKGVSLNNMSWFLLEKPVN